MGRRIKGILIVLILLWPHTPFSQDIQKIPLFIRQKEIWVEVARTPEERSRGLMGRRYLGRDEGMLFIFETEDYHGFWMKDTLIPLSIAFIDRKGQIIGIMDMTPLSLKSHFPPKPSLYALEMNQGWFSSNGINIGDIIRFSK